MTELNSLEAEQASMYRWIRTVMSPQMFYELTGAVVGPASTTPSLDIDRTLREEHTKFKAADAVNAMSDRSKIRSGLLPAELGEALQEYTGAVIGGAMFTEGLGGQTYGDIDREIASKFKQLCEQIARIR